ncbi:hypothetical protein [Halomonas shantousis]
MGELTSVDQIAQSIVALVLPLHHRAIVRGIARRPDNHASHNRPNAPYRHQPSSGIIVTRVLLDRPVIFSHCAW